MLGNYGYIGLFLIVAILFTVTTLLLPVALRFLKVIPHKPSPAKNATFECGMDTIGKTWVQFNVHYYFYAIVFLILDVLVVFLYPWAVALRELGYSGFIGVLILISIMAVGYIYVWRKNALEWK